MVQLASSRLFLNQPSSFLESTRRSVGLEKVIDLFQRQIRAIRNAKVRKDNRHHCHGAKDEADLRAQVTVRRVQHIWKRERYSESTRGSIHKANKITIQTAGRELTA